MLLTFVAQSGGLFCRGAFSVSPFPRHASGTRHGFDRWLAVLWGLRFLQFIFYRVSLASYPGRLEVWEWVLGSRIFAHDLVRRTEVSPHLP